MTGDRSGLLGAHQRELQATSASLLRGASYSAAASHAAMVALCSQPLEPNKGASTLRDTRRWLASGGVLHYAQKSDDRTASSESSLIHPPVHKVRGSWPLCQRTSPPSSSLPSTSYHVIRCGARRPTSSCGTSRSGTGGSGRTPARRTTSRPSSRNKAFVDLQFSGLL